LNISHSQTEHMKIFYSLNLTIENHLSSARDLSVILTNEPQLRHQIEHLIEIRNKIKEQFDVNLFLSFIYFIFEFLLSLQFIFSKN
jgi:hypothetical protein